MLLSFERRWTHAVMSGFAPDEPIDWALGVERFLQRANLTGRLGVRLGVLLAVTAPLWCWGRLRSAMGLDAADRARLLEALLSHRIYAVRELALLLKLVACMALFQRSGVRAGSGYDPHRERATLLPAEPRPAKLRLSVVREVA